MLQKLGFQIVRNRLLFECDVSNKDNIVNKIDFSFFRLNPNISLKFKLFVKNIPNNTYIYDDNQNIDNIVSELIDSLPNEILQQVTSKINAYIGRNDFKSLAKFLNQKRNEYQHQRTANEHNINDDDKFDCRKNIATTISELIDQLPDSILDKISDDINTYVEKKDFQSLVKFLRKHEKRSNIKMYNDMTYYKSPENIGKLDL